MFKHGPHALFIRHFHLAATWKALALVSLPLSCTAYFDRVISCSPFSDPPWAYMAQREAGEAGVIWEEKTGWASIPFIEMCGEESWTELCPPSVSPPRDLPDYTLPTQTLSPL